MENRLEVEVGAKIKEFQSKLAKALKGFDKIKAKNKELELAYKKGEISQDKYYDSLAKNTTKLKSASDKINQYKSSLTNTDKSMNQLSKGTANGASAMTAFSRTVQDAPFGLMGVSNNITNLTEQFGYLKKSTGSTGGAFKAMLKDLKGFGGITLGISAVTSLLLVFGDKIEFAKNKTKEFTDALEGVSTNAIIEFQTLTDVMLDNNATQKEQSKALSILKDKYSDFDTSILTTKGNYEKTKIAIDNYVGSLVNQARAQAGLSKIEEKQGKIIALQEKRRAKIQSSFGARDLEGLEKRRKRYLDANNKQLAENEELRKKREKQINERFDAVKNLGEKEISELEFQIQRLSKLSNIKDLILFGGKGKSKQKTQKQDVFIDFKLEEGSFDDFETIDLPGTDWVGDNAFNWDNYFKLKDFDEKQKLLKEKMTLLNEQSKQMIEGAMNNTFSGIGRAIGNGLAQGTNVLAAVGGALLSGVGNLVSAMGDKLIQLGTAAVLAGTVTKLFGAVAGIGAGLAAIAGGIALNAVGSGISNFGGNSSSSQSTNSNAGQGSSFSGGSGFSGGGSSFGGGNVVFEIQGKKLVGVLKNTLDANRNLGGTLTI